MEECKGGIPRKGIGKNILTTPQNSLETVLSRTDMTGRPGDPTMEMNGGSAAPYVARTPRVLLFMLILIGLEAKGLFRLPGARWERFRCAVEPLPGHVRYRPEIHDFQYAFPRPFVGMPFVRRVFAPIIRSQKSFREITLNYSKLT